MILRRRRGSRDAVDSVSDILFVSWESAQDGATLVRQGKDEEEIGDGDVDETVYYI